MREGFHSPFEDWLENLAESKQLLTDGIPKRTEEV